MNRHERQQEVERLKKLTGREIEFRTIECPCDYWKFCPDCKGEGSYFEAFYEFCGHVVRDGADLECEDGDCAERERLSAIMKATEHLDPPEWRAA